MPSRLHLVRPNSTVTQGGAPEITGVSGTVSHGNSITISGSGFGTRADYGGTTDFLCAGFSDLNAVGLSGETTNIEWNISAQAEYANQWTAQSTSPRVTGKNFIRRVNSDQNNYEGGGDIGIDPQTGSTWFISWWMRLATAADQQSGKFFRIYGSATNIYLSAGGENMYLRGYAEYTDPGVYPVYTSPDVFGNETWQRVDIAMSQDPDWFKVYIDGALQWQKSSTLPPSGDHQEDQWVENPFGQGSVGIGGYLDAGFRGYGVDGKYDFDDLFIDYTWARIELGNASTWAGSTHREVQLPTAWADGSITAQVNTGSFSSGTAYLYVVNSSGLVSPGYSVTVS